MISKMNTKTEKIENESIKTIINRSGVVYPLPKHVLCGCTIKYFDDQIEDAIFEEIKEE